MSFTNRQVTVNVPIKQIVLPKKEEPKIEIKVTSSDDILLEANKHSQLLLQEAVDKKNQLINDALKDIEVMKKQAYEQAYDAGFELGLEEGKTLGYEKVVKQSSEYINMCQDEYFQAQKETATYLQALNPKLLDLIKLITEKIILKELTDSDEKILPQLKSILKEISHRKKIFIRTHSNVYQVVKECEAQLKDMCIYGSLKIIEDISLEPFGCVVETESEMINLQLSNQLDNLFKELESVVS